MKTSIVIATFNEAENILSLIKSIRQSTPGVGIIIMDDNSPDGTAQIALKATNNDLLKVVIRYKDKGYAKSILEGMKIAFECGADRIITMDADFSHDPFEIPKLLEALEGADLVIGSRYINGVRILNWDIKRLLLSIFANKYVRLLTDICVNDCTSGFRCYSREVVEKVIISQKFRSNGYSFLVELLYHISKSGYKIREVPIVFSERREGKSKMSRRMMMEAAITPILLRIRRTHKG
jgi:dolichol-phosphate mannosyltransferase